MKKEIKKLPNENNAPQPKTVTNDTANTPTPTEQAETTKMPLQEDINFGEQLPVEEGTVNIPAVKEKLEPEDEKEKKISLKFKINPAITKSSVYLVEDFKDFVQQYRDKFESKPNTMYVNTDSLESLGYRDIATDFGIHIKEGRGYDPKELVLAIEY